MTTIHGITRASSSSSTIHRDASSDENNPKSTNTVLNTLAKMNNVVSSALYRSIRRGNSNAQKMNKTCKEQQQQEEEELEKMTTTKKKTENDDSTPLVDYLTVKNSLTMSYLIDLVLLLRSQLVKDEFHDNNNHHYNHHPDDSSQIMMECLERLQEMKIALEKIRPLEKKMRYQIDKLLALSTILSENGIIGGEAGMFASLGREKLLHDDNDDDNNNNEKEDTGVVDDFNVDDSSDPLSYKPNLRGMMKNMLVGENDKETGEGGAFCNDDDDDDEKEDEKVSNRAKTYLDKDEETRLSSSNVYQPPRLQSVPFELDSNDRAIRKHERDIEKYRERQSRSELTQVIKSQFTDAPEEEDARGGVSLGLQSDRSRKISSRNAELEAFEEGHMMRLSVGRKEKKERKRMMREEMSNLGAIADGFGNVVAGVDDAFGGGSRKRTTTTTVGSGNRESMADSSYKTKGMRRRKVDVIDHEGGARKKNSKKGRATNTYQKSLYGGEGGKSTSGGRGGGRKSRK